MTPEGRVKAAVDTVLKKAAAYYHKPVMNGMGAPALDYHVCHEGRYAAIETKDLGKVPTERQIRTMREVSLAGGSVFLIDKIGGPDYQELIQWMLIPATSAFVSSLAKVWMQNK